MKASVILFKPSGKYSIEEEWEVPIGRALTPYAMINSPDFRRINGGPVLVPTQEPWGYPALLVDPEPTSITGFVGGETVVELSPVEQLAQAVLDGRTFFQWVYNSEVGNGWTVQVRP